MRTERRRRAPSRRPRPATIWLLIALLYLPIAILFLFSINAEHDALVSAAGASRWAGTRSCSTTPALLRAARNSLVVAAGSSAVATVARDDGRAPDQRATSSAARGCSSGLAVLPLIVPFVVLAVALLDAVLGPASIARS